MRRREFILALAGAAAWPLAARAQQPGSPTVGFLHVASADRARHLVSALRSGLEEAGYREPENLRLEFRWAEGEYDRLPALAADLVGRHVALVVTGGGPPSALAAKAATATIPIVFNVSADPVAMGLVASLGRPGGNATGVNIFASETEAKRLGLLHEIIPAGSPIAYLVNPTYPPAEGNVREVEAAAGLIGRQILRANAISASEIDTAFTRISQRGAGAVLVGADPFFLGQRNQIVALAALHAVPAIYEQREFALAGGLMSYGTSLAEAYVQQGFYAGRILKGEKPADLPVMQLTRFELVINMKTAKALSLTIPPGVLAIADEVIE